MQFQIAALVAATFAGLTSAYTQPVGPAPVGNPTIHPAVGEIVPVGKPYDITWNPTTSGTVTLLLLNGPSTNIKVLYPIVEKIPNSGKYTWTPSSALQPDVTHYGIEIVVDSNGQYQYTPQFGISNNAYVSSSSSASGSASAPPAYTSSIAPVYSSSHPASTAPATTTPCTTTSGAPTVYTTPVVVPVTSAWSNSTITTVAKPTVSATGTTSSVPVATGAAGRVAANAVAAFAGFGAIAMLALYADYRM